MRNWPSEPHANALLLLVEAPEVPSILPLPLGSVLAAMTINGASTSQPSRYERSHAVFGKRSQSPTPIAHTHRYDSCVSRARLSAE
jgi:hypothetical protein